MSDILIRGMDLPEDKEICLRIDEKGEVYVYGSYPTELHKAIPVPPHGRLIDIGSWTFPTPHRNPSNDYMRGWNACLKSVLQQTTVIPAEEGE